MNSAAEHMPLADIIEHLNDEDYGEVGLIDLGNEKPHCSRA